MKNITVTLYPSGRRIVLSGGEHHIFRRPRPPKMKGKLYTTDKYGEPDKLIGECTDITFEPGGEIADDGRMLSDSEYAMFIRELASAVVDVLTPGSKSVVSIKLSLAINPDDIREQLLTVTRAHKRQILTNDDVLQLEKVIELLDDILEKAINAQKMRNK